MTKNMKESFEMDENLTYGEVLTPHLMQKKFLISPLSG